MHGICLPAAYGVKGQVRWWGLARSLRKECGEELVHRVSASCGVAQEGSRRRLPR